MATFRRDNDKYVRVDFYGGRPVWGREESFGVYRTCVEGFRGGEHACSGPGAKERAIHQALIRIDAMRETL